MMTDSTTAAQTQETRGVPGRPPWSFGKMYDFIADSLPDFRTKRNVVDVPRLAVEFGISEEAIYKWFRFGRLTARNARRLNDLVNEPDNQAKLKQANRTPPGLNDFYEFVK